MSVQDQAEQEKRDNTKTTGGRPKLVMGGEDGEIEWLHPDENRLASEGTKQSDTLTFIVLKIFGATVSRKEKQLLHNLCDSHIGLWF